MIVCPVCEHQQAQGLECDVCGKQLAAGPVASVPVQALPDLESTALPVAPELPAQRVDGLETTQLASGPDLPPVRLVDVEATAAAPIGAVTVQSVSDLERGRYVDTDPRTTVGARTCRYCHNVQPQGATCVRCGMLLPALEAEPSVPGAPVARRKGELTVVKCLQCGSRVAVGEICGGCGVVA